MTQAAAEASEIPATAEPTPPGGHPLGLYILFGTEMWERFCYYGMRALLVLYLIEGFGWQPHDSSVVYKWYTSLVYLTPLLGGYLADRYLGIRWSIVIGGVLMAVGEFALTTGTLTLFYLGLGLLIVGNGFFKPNISTLVGKMYKQGDARRDGAFTIFYMGINLGAGLAPIILSRIRHAYGFRYGFAGAGVGMLIGLTIFLLGLKRIRADVAAAGNTVDAKDEEPVATTKSTEKEVHRGEDEALPGATGAAGVLAKIMPIAMLALAVLVPIKFIYAAATGASTWTDIFMPIAFSIIAGAMAMVLYSIRGQGRDKSIVIFTLFFFVVLFWMAFEQAGNALNLWAEFFTHRETLGWKYTAEDFQSINAVFIVILAPVFAWLWLWLAKKKLEPSTPMKMAIAMVFVALSFVAMLGAAVAENAKTHSVALSAVPSGVDVSKLDAGRMRFDAAGHELAADGVVAEYVINGALADSASPDYKRSLDQAIDASTKAKKDSPVRVTLAGLPDAFELPVSKEGKWTWHADSKELEMSAPIEPTDKTGLVNAGAPPEWRKSIRDLQVKSHDAQVSSFWLVLSYFLATIGELCLSPVGLSMVTKLAPKRFASLFMGVWLLSSSVAQYAGGSIGESWGKITPSAYFNLFVVTSAIGAVILFALVMPLKKLMHNT